jgi:hypothetical protein
VNREQRLDLKRCKKKLFEMVGADQTGSVRVVKYREDLTEKGWLWGSPSA